MKISASDQILLGVALIVVLAVGSQLLAGQLRIPSLIILLPARFIVGPSWSGAAGPDRA